MTTRFRRRRDGDGVYQLTQRERALEVHQRLTQTVEDERLLSSSPPSHRASDPLESGMSRPSVPFTRVIPCPNHQTVGRESDSNQVSSVFPSPSIPPDNPQASSTESHPLMSDDTINESIAVKGQNQYSFDYLFNTIFESQ